MDLPLPDGTIRIGSQPGRMEIGGVAPPGVEVHVAHRGQEVGVGTDIDGAWSLEFEVPEVDFGGAPTSVQVWFQPIDGAEHGPVSSFLVEPGRTGPFGRTSVLQYNEDLPNAEPGASVFPPGAQTAGLAEEAPGAVTPSTGGSAEGRSIEVDATPLTDAEARRMARALRDIRLEPPGADAAGEGLSDEDRRRVAIEMTDARERAALDPPFAQPGHLALDPDAGPVEDTPYMGQAEDVPSDEPPAFTPYEPPAPPTAEQTSTGEAPAGKSVLQFSPPEMLGRGDLAPSTFPPRAGTEELGGTPSRSGDEVPPSAAWTSEPDAGRWGGGRRSDGWFPSFGGFGALSGTVAFLVIVLTALTLGLCTYNSESGRFVLKPPPVATSAGGVAGGATSTGPTSTSEPLPTTVARGPADLGGAVAPPPVATPGASASAASTSVAAPASAANLPPVVRSLTSTLATPVTRWVVQAEDPDGDVIRYTWVVAGTEKCGTPRLDIGPVEGAEVRWSHATAAPDSCAHPSPNHDDVVVTLSIRAGSHRLDCVMRGTESRTWDPSQVCTLQRG